MLALAPCIHSTRLHGKTAHIFAAAERHQLIIVKNILHLVGGQLIWRRHCFLYETEAQTTFRTNTPCVDGAFLGRNRRMKPSTTNLDSLLVWQSMIRPNLDLRGIRNYFIGLLFAQTQQAVKRAAHTENASALIKHNPMVVSPLEALNACKVSITRLLLKFMIDHNRLQLSSFTVNVAVVLIIIGPAGLENFPADRLWDFKVLVIIIEA